ncbi:MAG: hypothetical protein R2851_01195 [Caldilineaceae bacterium]
MNMLPHLHPDDRPRALWSLAAVARDSFGHPARFCAAAARRTPDVPTLKRWFRRFIEVRDDEGAERCIVSLAAGRRDVRGGGRHALPYDADHRYIDVGHPADFTNKALEAAGHHRLGGCGDSAHQPGSYANAARNEECTGARRLTWWRCWRRRSINWGELQGRGRGR